MTVSAKLGVAAIAVLLSLGSTTSRLHAQEAHEFQQQIVNQLSEAAATLGRDGYRQVEQYVDADGLSQEQSHIWDITLVPGVEHVITAVCDQDCSDLDLVLYEDGNPVDEDTEPDAYPTIVGLPGDHSYQIEVIMYGCEVEPCYYGYSIFRK